MRKKIMMPVICVMLLALGLEYGGYQFALLKVATEYELSTSLMGVMMCLQYATFIFAPLVFGRLSDKVGKKKIVTIFIFVFMIGCIMAATIHSIFAFAAGIFILGWGYSVSESVSTAAIADVYPEKAIQFNNISQCFFAAGNVLGPLMLDLVMTRYNMSWRMLFYTCAAVALISAIPMFFVDFKPKAAPVNVVAAEPRDKKKVGFRSIFNVLFVLLFIAQFAYVSVESGLTFFMDTLFTQELNMPQLSSISLSIFWLVIIISRLASTAFAKYPRATLVVCFIGCMAGTFLLFLSHNAIVCIVAAAATALFGAPIWPTIMGIGTALNPDNTGTTVSVLMSACGIAGATMGLTMGSLGEAVGIRGAYLVVSLVSVVGLAAMIIYCILTRKKKA